MYASNILKKTTAILILLNAMASYSSIAQHQSLSKKVPVEIMEIKVLGEAKKGDTFTLLVRYKSMVDAESNFSIHLPNHANFNNRATEVKSQTISDKLTKNRVQTQKIEVQAHENGNGMYEIQFSVPDAPNGYSRSVSEHIKIYSAENEFEIFSPKTETKRQPLTIGTDIQTFIGENPYATKSKVVNAQTQSILNYSVSVSGKIRFYKGFPEYTYKGVYGNDVVLWFRNSNNPNTWYHPVSGDQQHVHYDILDEQGNFSFNFSFSGDLSAYNEFIVLLNTSNNAAIMPAPQDGYISYGGSGYTAYFNESEGLEVSISPGQTNISVIQNGQINSNHGQVLRYSMISKEFLEELYDGSMTFSVPAIPTRIADISSCGLFTNSYSFLQGWNQSIDIDPNCIDFSTVSHEYGHWTNYRMWTNDSKWNGAKDALQEGFAIFYSFAARNYGNKQYDDDFEQDEDNPEEDAFVTSPYRYAGINYASPSAPSFGKSAAAFSAYLWNLYDNVEDTEFLASTYDSNDNDDIRGKSERVFEKMRTLVSAPGNESIFNYNSHFKSGLATEEITSVDKLHSFMFDDLYALPSTKMKPAQVKNLEATEGSTTTTINWNSSSYSSGSYNNFESGYNIYKKSGSNWQYIGQVSLATSYTVSNPSSVTTYKVSSYNSSGESADAPEIVFGPLTVNISGGSVYSPGGFGYWSGTASGGQAPYNLKWYRSYNSGSGPWTQVGTGSSYSQIVNQEMWLNLNATESSCSGVCPSGNDIIFIDVISCPFPPCNPLKTVPHSVPVNFDITQNYPNPFNPSTNLAFELPEQAQVSLTVYNIMGQKVTILVGDNLNAGFHTYNFDASSLPSGVYVAQMEAIGLSGEVFSKSIKMQLIK